MRLKVNIREFIEDNADHNDMLLVHASVDVDDLFETNCIPEEHEIDVDIHELLAKNRRIAHIWGIEDVQEIRPDLNPDQAWDVLHKVWERLDSRDGITWDILSAVADRLYPKRKRHAWAGRIDVSVENYTRAAAIEHFEGMARHIERDAVNSTTKAEFDPASLRPAQSDETISE
jgi:hypothetical protein